MELNLPFYFLLGIQIRNWRIQRIHISTTHTLLESSAFLYQLVAHGLHLVLWLLILDSLSKYFQLLFSRTFHDFIPHGIIFLHLLFHSCKRYLQKVSSLGGGALQAVGLVETCESKEAEGHANNMTRRNCLNCVRFHKGVGAGTTWWWQL